MINDNTLVIFVTGQLLISGSANPVNFAQAFTLIATGPGAYYVHNDLFRLTVA